MFDRLAPEYDAVGPACFAYFGRHLVEEAGVGYGQRVLDVACGRGAVLFSAAERAGTVGEVIGIDLAEEMVRATNVARASGADSRHSMPRKRSVFDPRLTSALRAIRSRTVCTSPRRRSLRPRSCDKPPSAPDK
jgi:SAM-dependent methyltransferase